MNRGGGGQGQSVSTESAQATDRLHELPLLVRLPRAALEGVEAANPVAVDGLHRAVRDGARDLEPGAAQVALVRVLGAEPLSMGGWVDG